MYRACGSGYVIGIDEEDLDLLMGYHEVTDDCDLQNVIVVGDYEPNRNIDYVNAPGVDYPQGTEGVWYIRADETDKDMLASQICQLLDIINVEFAWCDNFEILLYD